MRNFIINLYKDKVEIVDIHLTLFSRIKIMCSLIFSGYLSFHTAPEAKINYNGFKDGVLHRRSEQ